jgi:hypothetical protein
MALISMQYHNGIFYTRGESNLTTQDATMWKTDLKACAAAQGGRVVAMLDLSKASRIASSSYILIADVARSSSVSALVIIARGATMSEAARAIAAMSERGRVHLFETMSEARLFAEVCAHNDQAAYA